MPFLYVTLLVIIFDQMTKLMIQTKMFPLQSFPVIKNWFSLTYVANYGAAFGILQSQTFLLIGITFGVLIFIWLKRKEVHSYPRILQVGLAVALGGAIGNLCDRIRLGYVLDFFDFHVWPVFNIADIAIVTGVCLIIFGLLKTDITIKNKRSQEIGGSIQSFDPSASGEDKS